jgi:hypothetical protein
MVKSKTKRAVKNNFLQRKMFRKKIKRIKKMMKEMFKVILIHRVQLQRKELTQVNLLKT